MVNRENFPVVGDNNVALTVKDAAGKEVSDAKVMIDYSMPAMSYKATCPDERE